MKVVLTKEEVTQATIMYLKSKSLINNNIDFVGKVLHYDDDKFLTITEFKPTVEETKEEETA